MSNSYQDVQVTFDGHVATVEMCKPPHNFFTIPLIRALADAFEARQILLADLATIEPDVVGAQAPRQRRHQQEWNVQFMHADDDAAGMPIPIDIDEARLARGVGEGVDGVLCSCTQ